MASTYHRWKFASFIGINIETIFSRYKCSEKTLEGSNISYGFQKRLLNKMGMVFNVRKQLFQCGVTWSCILRAHNHIPPVT